MPMIGALPTLPWIEAFTTSHLTCLAVDFTNTAKLWEESFTQLASDILRPGGFEWDGPGADAAQGSADRAGFTARGASNQLRDAAGIAGFGADQLDGLHRKTLAVIQDARDSGFQVNEDLSVADTRTSRSTAEQTARQIQAEEHAEHIQSHAAHLLALDSEYAAKIETATEGVDIIAVDGHGNDTLTIKGRNGIQLVDWKQAPADPGGTSNPTDPLRPVHNGKDVKDLLTTLEKGNNKGVSQLAPADIRRLYDWIVRNSVGEAPPSTYPGPARVLEDGSIIRMREGSKTGGPTLDVTYPDGTKQKIHLPAPIITPPPERPPVLDHPPAAVSPTALDHPPVTVPPASRPTPLLPPWLQDPSPPGFQVLPAEPPPIAPLDVPGSPPPVSGRPPAPSGAGPFVLPPGSKEHLGLAGLAGIGAAILSGAGKVGSWLAHPSLG